MTTHPARNVPKRGRPLDAARLEELALAYVARFATTRAKLEGYLARKLRERGWAGEEEPPVAALAARFADAGYVDDRAWAASKSRSLLQRGYGAGRIAQALAHAGVGEDDRDAVRVSEADGRRAALALARKRGFGPFGSDESDRARRDKQLAAMLRAGHAADVARYLLAAPTVDAAEEWAAEAWAGEGDEACD